MKNEKLAGAACDGKELVSAFKCSGKATCTLQFEARLFMGSEICFKMVSWLLSGEHSVRRLCKALSTENTPKPCIPSPHLLSKPPFICHILLVSKRHI